MRSSVKVQKRQRNNAGSKSQVGNKAVQPKAKKATVRRAASRAAEATPFLMAEGESSPVNGGNGIFKTGVLYAAFMDLLDQYIQAAEDFRSQLSCFDADEIPSILREVRAFHSASWLEICVSKIYNCCDKTQMQEFRDMFDSTTTVLEIQFLNIIEKRAKELGVDKEGIY